jgi:hypothetical protein
MAEHLVREILGFSDDRMIQTAINQITAAEAGIEKATQTPTLDYEDFRDIRYKTTEQRLELRKQIFNELIKQVRPDNDDEIELGNGGALPKTDLKKKSQFCFLIGLPASGKSFVANLVCDKTGSILLDSDYAKRKLPEYRMHGYGASLVHKESQAIIMGYQGDKESPYVFDYCLSENINMVYPCIGHRLNEIVDLAETVKANGYKTHLVLVDLDRFKATKRAYTRYEETKRYIPLAKIFEDYANDPSLTYYRAKQRHEKLFDSFCHIDTDVTKNAKYKIIEKTGNSPLIQYRPRKPNVERGQATP